MCCRRVACYTESSGLVPVVFGTQDAQMLEERNWRQTILKAPQSRRPTPSKAPSASWGMLRSIPRLAPGASEELPHANRTDAQLPCRTGLASCPTFLGAAACEARGSHASAGTAWRPPAAGWPCTRKPRARARGWAARLTRRQPVLPSRGKVLIPDHSPPSSSVYEAP